jgi:hypothetical protein
MASANTDNISNIGMPEIKSNRVATQARPPVPPPFTTHADLVPPPPPTPRVDVSDDRVTFTVQHEIRITTEKSHPSSAALSENQWLSTFAATLALRDKEANSGAWGAPAAAPPSIQALYHSSVLPIPCSNAKLGFQTVSNGLVSACLTAFTQVCARDTLSLHVCCRCTCIATACVTSRCSTSASSCALMTSSSPFSMPPQPTCSKTAKRHATCSRHTRDRRCGAECSAKCNS